MARLPTVGGDNGSWGTVLNEFLSVGINTDGTLKNVLGVNVKDYGAVGDNATDDTAAIQTAINAANTTAHALFPFSEVNVVFPIGKYKCSGLTNPGQVHLIGNGAVLVANASGPILTFTGQYGGISQMSLAGGGSGMNASGIFINTTFHNLVNNCRFDNFAGSAITFSSTAIGNWVRNAFAQNCLLATGSLATYTGVLDLDGTDNWIENCEFTASRTSISSSSLYADAVVVKGSNHMISGVVAEISDVGFVLNASNLKLVNCRGDLNRGHGWMLVGGGGSISGCQSLNNSQDTDGGWHGVYVPGSSATAYRLTAFESKSISVANRHGQGYVDLQNSASSKNIYDSTCVATGSTGAHFFTTDSNGASFNGGSHAPITITPGVTSYSFLSPFVVTSAKFANVAPLTFTIFGATVPGQRIVLIGDGFTTIKHGTSFILKGGADLLLEENATLDLIRNTGVWYEI